MKKLALALFLLAFTFCAGLLFISQQPPVYDALVWWIARQLDTAPGDDPLIVEFEIREGESASSIAQRLEAERLISNAWVFRTMAKMRGIDAQLEPGHYGLRRNMTANQVLDEFQRRRFLGSTITVPEGWRAEQIADLLERRAVVGREEFLSLVKSDRSDPRLASSIPAGLSLEGYLFPDTYRVPPRISAAEVLGLMTENFDRRFPESLSQKASAQGLTLHQVVTLASIVEREAVVPSERPLIAGVYLNRWRSGMKLDADPTVQYAVALVGAGPEDGQDPYWKGSLTYEDLAVDSPYNTYRYVGFPPGPICNPGLASLTAVIEAENTDYLYFVARPDGSHDFSRTMEEHLEKVRKYQ